jgi:hypothetical protein
MNTLNCDDLMSKLDEYLDGVLGEPEAIAVHNHLENCADCRKELEATRQLMQAAQALPRSIEPERDLWPDIASTIEGQRVVHGFFGRDRAVFVRRFAVAAAAAAVLIGAASVAYLAGLNRSQPQIAHQPLDNSSYLTAAYSNVDTDLSEARDQLRARLEQRRDELSPETWSVVVENLEVIDDAIARIEVALEDNPEDGRLNRRLAVAYLRQIDLLQRATRLPAEI